MFHLKKFVLFGVISMIIIDQSYGSLTQEQYIITMNVMRDVCFYQFKSITPEKTAQLREKKFPEDRDLKCYTNCVWEGLGMMEDGVFDVEHSIQQVEHLVPVDQHDSYKKAVHACKDAAKDLQSDHCEASYAVVKCMFENNPNFFFP